MQIKNGKDFWAGLMFMGFGLGFTLVAQNYPMGSAVRMGPAYFPTVLGGMLAVLGGMVFLAGCQPGRKAPPQWPSLCWRWAPGPFPPFEITMPGR